MVQTPGHFEGSRWDRASLHYKPERAVLEELPETQEPVLELGVQGSNSATEPGAPLVDIGQSKAELQLGAASIAQIKRK